MFYYTFIMYLKKMHMGIIIINQSNINNNEE